MNNGALTMKNNPILVKNHYVSLSLLLSGEPVSASKSHFRALFQEI
jgi:hypothetical protein